MFLRYTNKIKLYCPKLSDLEKLVW